MCWASPRFSQIEEVLPLHKGGTQAWADVYVAQDLVWNSKPTSTALLSHRGPIWAPWAAVEWDNTYSCLSGKVSLRGCCAEIPMDGAREREKTENFAKVFVIFTVEFWKDVNVFSELISNIRKAYFEKSPPGSYEAGVHIYCCFCKINHYIKCLWLDQMEESLPPFWLSF